MSLLFFKRMEERVDFDKTKSDTDYFQCLLYFGELLTKTVCSGMLSAVVEGKDQSQYSLRYKLVRSSGVGDWGQVLNEIISGPTATKVVRDASPEMTELTKRVGTDEWQHKAVSLMQSVASQFDPNCEATGSKVNLKQWFQLFSFLRNKSKGHGAPASDLLSRVCINLHESITIIVNNFCLFEREWVHLRQNLSSKYHVFPISKHAAELQKLASAEGKSKSHTDGIYVLFDKPRKVKLISAAEDLNDFYFPNGSFTSRQYEKLSYRTGEKTYGDSNEYSTPPGELQPSETKALTGLDQQGNLFGNFPAAPPAYISRKKLEAEIQDLLLDERNPVITLHGRGGIGKTSTVLTVLHQLCHEDHFDLIVWFSARDIDLFEHSPTKVKPDVLSLGDMANQFADLVDPEERQLKEFSATEYFKDSLGSKILEKPTVFVFDNFETTTDPVDLFNLINTHIRLPNKVIITTRHRDFKGDYPVTVLGMEENEATLLINDYSSKLGISDIITDQYKYNLYKESDGHPYIIKVLLGEAKKSGSAKKVERVMAAKKDMLDALFERTYGRLSASAKKTFLTLSNRRYIIPKVALEAVMLRPGNDLYDVEEALVELENCSFIEILYSNGDGVEYISVPLTASLFGKKKLAVSAHKPHVEIDTKYFDLFGPTQRANLNNSFDSRIHQLVGRIKERIKRGNDIQDFIHILKYIASQHTRTWLIISDLFAEQNVQIDEAKSAIRQFIQNSNQEDAYLGWQKLEELCWRTADYNCQVQCLYEICNLDKVEYRVLSDAANVLNKLLHEQKIDYKTEEKKLIPKSSGGVSLKPSSAETGRRLTPKMVRMGTA